MRVENVVCVEIVRPSGNVACFRSVHFACRFLELLGGHIVTIYIVMLAVSQVESAKLTRSFVIVA